VNTIYVSALKGFFPKKRNRVKEGPQFSLLWHMKLRRTRLDADMPFSGVLRIVESKFFTDVSGQRIGSIFDRQEIFLSSSTY
jgi:hypothetical protein